MRNQSRETLVQAMIDIIAERGFEGLSVRNVAARAGVSIGAVQHHFPTKTAMLDAAMTTIASLAAEHDDLTDPATPGERLHALVDLLVPDNEGSHIARVWLAFASRATVDENVRKAYAELWTRLRSELGLLFAAAGNPSDAGQTAWEFLALLDGLTLGVIAENQHSDTAKRIAHRRLDELLRENS